MDRKRDLLWRTYCVLLCFVLVALVIVFKVFTVSVIERDKWKQEAEANVQWRAVDADRGNIYDDEFNLLSTSIQLFEVRMDLQYVKDKTFYDHVDSLAYSLANFSPSKTTKKSASQWKKALVEAKKKKNGYFLIAKNLDIDEYNTLKKMPLFRLGKTKSGMITLRLGRRIRPFNGLAARTIGLDRENADKIGLEGYFDKYLTGDTDMRLMKRLYKGDNIWVPVFDPSENEIRRGDDIITTINVGMQDIVHTTLNDQLVQSQAEGGTAILMEVKTGAIKAIANLTKAEDGQYYEMYNSAIGRLSEPGSTMKLVTILALLEEGVTNVDTLVHLNMGAKRFADRVMHDSEKHGKMYATMAECFEISSNVGIASLANDIYNSKEGRLKWINRLHSFGLHEPLGIDIAGEAMPEIKHPIKQKDKWYGTTIPWMAHGYELMLTPLHMLNFYNAVVNDGKLMRPFLVSEIRNDETIKKQFEPQVLISKIAKKENLQKARKMMEGVVLRGTAKNIQSDIVSLAGKTGTTRINYAQTGEYAKYNASFCGYFPAEDPQYSMIVVVYNPQGAFYGGTVAAPVFKKVAEKIYATKSKSFVNVDSIRISDENDLQSWGYRTDFVQLLDGFELKGDVSNKGVWAKVSGKGTTFDVRPVEMDKAKVPNVKGLSLRDAVFILEEKGLRVKVNGVGKVYSQSIKAGTSVKGQTIIIQLK